MANVICVHFIQLVDHFVTKHMPQNRVGDAKYHKRSTTTTQFMVFSFTYYVELYIAITFDS